jgi:DNA-binding transcriptional MerR regulator
MEKYRAIPQGYMTTGEVAKKMNTTVRTLQYYDKEGVLKPSAESAGGRRLYTDKDIVKLHQIQSMKYLGFSLDDIKTRLVSLETPTDVANALTEQAEVIREKIATLADILHAIERLKEETLQMQTVDFRKYADIIVNLQLKNEFYGIIKYFDEKTLDHIRSRFDMKSGIAIADALNKMFEKAAEFHENGMEPESKEGQELAKVWWDMVMEFTGGDMSLLPGLLDIAENKNIDVEKWNEKWSKAEPFITKALAAYFADIGYNPFEEVKQ